jgi:ribonuclease PH
MSSVHARTRRKTDELRPLTIETGVAPYAEGSALIAFGSTRIWCTASVEERVPPWLTGKGQGWVTAEYSMLPRSTHTRVDRQRAGSSGRSQEISRLIGRSLRAGVDLKRLGARTITVDCDVLQADGGTRTAAITGGFVALALACNLLARTNVLPRSPITGRVAAVSAGMVAGEARLDLDYAEDAAADVDCNVVMDSRSRIIELQATSEGVPLSREELDALVDLAGLGIEQILDRQRLAIEEASG